MEASNSYSIRKLARQRQMKYSANSPDQPLHQNWLHHLTSFVCFPLQDIFLTATTSLVWEFVAWRRKKINQKKKIIFKSSPWSEPCLQQTQTFFSYITSWKAPTLQRHLPCDKIYETAILALFSGIIYLSTITVPPSAHTTLATSLLIHRTRFSISHTGNVQNSFIGLAVKAAFNQLAPLISIFSDSLFLVHLFPILRQRLYCDFSSHHLRTMSVCLICIAVRKKNYLVLVLKISQKRQTGPGCFCQVSFNIGLFFKPLFFKRLINLVLHH